MLLLLSSLILFENKKVMAEEKSQIYFLADPFKTLILPQTNAITETMISDLQVLLAAGEYEAASFVIYAAEDLKNLELKVSPLKNDNKTLSKEAVDVRAVKCWYQSGHGAKLEKDKRLLVPELLLHDDDLVRVDYEKKENFLKNVIDKDQIEYVPISTATSEHLANIRPLDAKQLLPITIQKNSSKQFWITIHTPPNTAPGIYKYTISFNVKNTKLPTLNLSAHILPFRLLETTETDEMISIFYRGRLNVNRQISIDTREKSPIQYVAEIENLKNHGIRYAPFYQTYNEQLLRNEIQMREKVGLTSQGLFLSCWAERPSAEAARKWTKFLAPLGYPNVYFFEEPGVDYQQEKLVEKTARYKATREAGGKVFSWYCPAHVDDAMREQIDLAIGPNPGEIEKIHRLRRKILRANLMPVDEQNIENFRRDHGLVRWQDKFDGVLCYCYQDHCRGHAWNDFDSSTRGFLYTYPTIDGVVDTLCWEAFREGIDDVRYLKTLIQAINNAPVQKQQIAHEAREWINRLNAKKCILAETRAEITKWILKLNQ